MGGPYFWLMLKRLHLKNFTVFADANFEFSPGLNVLVGTNGTGKSHVLKVGYGVEVIRGQVRNIAPNDSNKVIDWTGRLFYYLPDLFGVLRRRQLISNKAALENAFLEVDFNTEYTDVETVRFEINSEDGLRVIGGKEIANKEVSVAYPVFIPAKEVLAMSWMLPASEQLKIPIESNYIELLKQLRGLPLRNPVQIIQIVLQELSEILGGEVEEENGKYYLVDKEAVKIEATMMAEGLRKFGMLQKLLANGSLTPQATLYWDEPEANLNPALLRKLAAILAELARQGFQIILATHSMSLLKEFHILSREPDKEKLPIKYFGLNAEPGQPTTVVTRDDFKYLPDVVALEVELDQADDLEEIFARESR